MGIDKSLGPVLVSVLPSVAAARPTLDLLTRSSVMRPSSGSRTDSRELSDKRTEPTKSGRFCMTGPGMDGWRRAGLV